MTDDDKKLYDLTKAIYGAVFGCFGLSPESVVLPRKESDDFSMVKVTPADIETALNALGNVVAAFIAQDEDPKRSYQWFGEMLNNTIHDYQQVELRRNQ